MAPGPAFGWFVVALSLAIWPGIEQPGEIPRGLLLLIGGPLLVAVACRATDRGWPLQFGVALGLPVVISLTHVLRAEGGLATTFARETASIVALALVALAATLVDRDGPNGDAVDGAIERGACAALALLGLLGLAQAHLGFSAIPQSFAPAATFVNRNVAAQTLVVLVPLSVPMLAATRPFWSRWLAAPAVGAGVGLLIATRSRGAWLAALIGWGGVGLVWWLRRGGRGGPRTAANVAPIVVAVALVALSLMTPLQTATGSLPSATRTVGLLAQPLSGSGAERLAVWRNSIAMLADRPWLGFGPGSFETFYPRYGHAVVPTPGFDLERQPRHAHADLLELAVQHGLPTAAALLLVSLAGVGLALRRARGSDGAARATAGAAALAATLVLGLVSFPLQSAASASIFWLLLGRSWSGATGRRMPIVGRRTVAVVLVIAAAGAAWIGARELSAHRSVAEALGASTSGECAEALERASSAAQAAPWSRRTAALSSMVELRCRSGSLPSLERALRLNPAQPNLLLAVGAKRLEAGRLDSAASAFSEATEILPSLARAWVGLASVHALRGEPAEASRACVAAVGAAPGDEAVERFCVEGGLLTP